VRDDRLNAHLKAVRRGTAQLIQSMDENRAELYDLAPIRARAPTLGAAAGRPQALARLSSPRRFSLGR